MIHKPYCFHNMDDDYAPVDYTSVSSVSEGRRKEQLKNIHQAENRPTVRRRAEPGDVGHEPPSRRAAPGRSTVAGNLPSMADGPAPAARIAYPRASQIPENPFEPPEESVLAKGPARPAPPPMVAEDGSQFDPPAMAQLPEWYRVAQQNSPSREESLRRTPRVQAAPRYDAEEEPAQDILGRPVRRSRVAQGQAPKTTAQMYEEAGYPAPLLDEQRIADAEQETVSRRRRHGAQYAVREDRQADYLRSTGVQPEAAAAPQNAYSPQNGQGRRWRTDAENRGDDRGSAYAPSQTVPPRPRAADFAPRTAAPAPSGPSSRSRAAATASRAEGIPRSAAPLSHPSARQAEPPADASGGYASNPYARNIAPQAGYRVEPDDDPYGEAEEEPKRGYAIPWLGIVAFAAAFLAVGLWLLQLTFVNRTDQALTSRAEAAAMILDGHPYEYRELIEREAAKNNLNPAFVAAIIFNESTFRPGAESSVGARGLMQVMADTADSINKDLNVPNYSFDMLYDAETNLTFGCHYLGELSQRFRGDSILVAAAYHAGPNQVQNWLNTSTLSQDGQSLILDNMADGPTKQYAARVKRDFAIYRRLYYEDIQEGV